MTHHFTDDITITIAGQAGQGIRRVARLLTHVLKLYGFHVFTVMEHTSSERGETIAATIRISSEKKDAYRSMIDVFVSLDAHISDSYRHRFHDRTICMGHCDATMHHDGVFPVDFTHVARSVGDTLYTNVVSVGTVLGLLGVDEQCAREYMRSFFVTKEKSVITKNQEALSRGYKIGAHVAFSYDIHIYFASHEPVKHDLFMTGVDAVSCGALAGGVDFYAMPPLASSAAQLSFITQHAKECGVIAEQAIDEADAAYMALGATYAGARSIVTTTSCGLDAMCEAISLSGMTETPMTCHVCQHTGPAAGMLMHTGQEDLDTVLYAGHGEFMRAIFAPGTPAQAYHLTAHALMVADRYHVPTFVLTDHYFSNALYTIEKDFYVEEDTTKYIVETTRDYKKYAYTENGVSLRGVPGYGIGLVCANGEEHDDCGRTTTQRGTRMAMTEKRLFKRREVLEEVMIMPEIVGKKSARTMIVCWGSTRNVVVEAVETLDDKEISVVHFMQLFPLHKKKIKGVFAKAKKVIVVEQNATGQFARLLAKECDIKITKNILLWDGELCSVEGIREKLLTM